MLSLFHQLRLIGSMSYKRSRRKDSVSRAATTVLRRQRSSARLASAERRQPGFHMPGFDKSSSTILARIPVLSHIAVTVDPWQGRSN